MLLLGGALLGAFFGVRGQEARAPWPPPPVQDFEESEATPALVSSPPKSAVPVVPKTATPQPPLQPLPKVVDTASDNTGKDPAPAASSNMATDAPKDAPRKMPSPPPIPNLDLPDVSLYADPPPPAPTPKVTPNKMDPPAWIPPAPTVVPPEPIPPKKDPAKGVEVAPPPVYPPLPDIKDNPASKSVETKPTPVSPPLVPLHPPMKDHVAPEPKLPTTPPATPKSPPVVQMPTPLSDPPAPLKNMGPPEEKKRPPAFKLVVPLRKEPTPGPALEPLEKPLAQTPLGPGALTVATPNLGSLSGALTPQVVVEKRGPASLRAGEPASYLIVVRNVGVIPASQVRVEDDLPAGARLLDADPQPTFQNERAVWMLASLPPGTERQIRLEVQTPGGGVVASTTSVVVRASTTTRTTVAGHEGLSLVVTGPQSVPAGFPVVFEVKVTNYSKQTASGMTLHGRLSAGLSHPMGSNIEADVGDLAPGATKSFKMPLTATQAGKQHVEVRITTASGPEASGIGSVQVQAGGGASLRVNQPVAARVFINKESELRIEVRNNLAYGLKNVAVTDILPEGLEFAGASERGIYRPETRSVHWLLDKVEAEETRTLILRVLGKSSGNFTNEVIARTEAREETHSQGSVQVQGVTALSLQVKDREGPVEVGKSTVYEISVVNQGSAAATGVKVQALLPEGLEPAGARGPAPYQVAGRQVTFASLPKLAPQGQAFYYVNAVAQAAGERRVRVQVVSDQDPSPLVREERTHVYQD